MKRVFIVAIDPADIEKRNAFTEYVSGLGVSYWHWIDHFWMVVAHGGQTDAAALCDKIVELMPGVYHLVVEIGSVTHWTGYGPSQKERKDGEKPRNMFAWLREQLPAEERSPPSPPKE